MMKAHGDAIGPLDGIVELDEKYLGGKPRFEQGVIHPRGKGTSKSCIHVAVKRQGEAKAEVVPSAVIQTWRHGSPQLFLRMLIL